MYGNLENTTNEALFIKKRLLHHPTFLWLFLNNISVYIVFFPSHQLVAWHKKNGLFLDCVYFFPLDSSDEG